MKDEYTLKATELIAAIDIAIEAYKKHAPAEFTEDHLNLMITFFMAGEAKPKISALSITVELRQCLPCFCLWVSPTCC